MLIKYKKGSGINNLCIQALRVGSDLADLTEQNRRRSIATFRTPKICDFSGTPSGILRLRIGQRWPKHEMHQCASCLSASPEGAAMRTRIYSLSLAVVLSVAMFAAAQRVQATLGESAGSIESDRKALSAVKRGVTVRNSYTVQEIYSESNTVREYVSSSGIVFGIAWNGLVYPDITQLLGSYTGEYQKALQQTLRQKGSRHLQVKSQNVIVEKWGHMRNLQGRAYAPALIPPGVSVDEIK